MMTSTNGNDFRVTGPLWKESTSHQWILHVRRIHRSPVDSPHKQWSRQWSETPWCSLWRHNNKRTSQTQWSPSLVFIYDTAISSVQDRMALKFKVTVFQSIPRSSVIFDENYSSSICNKLYHIYGPDCVVKSSIKRMSPLMMTSSNGNIFRVTGLLWGEPPVTDGFPSKRQVTRSFDVFFGLRLNKRLSKHSRRQWFDTPPYSLWRHCNGICVRTELF